MGKRDLQQEALRWRKKRSLRPLRIQADKDVINHRDAEAPRFHKLSTSLRLGGENLSLDKGG